VLSSCCWAITLPEHGVGAVDVDRRLYGAGPICRSRPGAAIAAIARSLTAASRRPPMRSSCVRELFRRVNVTRAAPACTVGTRTRPSSRASARQRSMPRSAVRAEHWRGHSPVASPAHCLGARCL